MPAVTRQAKRPFQPSITSYFSSTNTNYPSPLRPSRTKSAPPLPAAIQSSLLNVGMRIRKSVPEGYKTGSSCALGAGPDKHCSNRVPTRSNASQTSAGDRQLVELTPYCGIMKVGGYATQQNDSARLLMSHAKEINEAIAFNSLLGPTQVSTASTGSIPAGDSERINPQKRRFDDDDGGDDNFGGSIRPDNTSESPFIYEDPATLPAVSLPKNPVRHTTMLNPDLPLPLARPQRSFRSAIPRPATFFFGNEENMDVDVRHAVLVPCGADFEEADFLQLHEWTDGEVEMSGL